MSDPRPTLFGWQNPGRNLALIAIGTFFGSLGLWAWWSGWQ